MAMMNTADTNLKEFMAKEFTAVIGVPGHSDLGR
jgi:hypothetical protein